MTHLTEAAVLLFTLAVSNALMFIFGWGVGSGRISSGDEERNNRW